ncbi:hypothetical protein BD408DRAFT_418352 [Parasitella parasitica]|nr:hypothetical protein BD408DRAFT_418352 [Parasitella parasitica]
MYVIIHVRKYSTSVFVFTVYFDLVSLEVLMANTARTVSFLGYYIITITSNFSS